MKKLIAGVVAALIVLCFHRYMVRPPVPATWPHTEPPPPVAKEDRARFYRGYDDLAFRLYRAAARSRRDTSFVVVPAVTHLALVTAYQGATGATHDAMTEELGLVSPEVSRRMWAEELALSAAHDITPQPLWTDSTDTELALDPAVRPDDIFLRTIEGDLGTRVVTRPSGSRGMQFSSRWTLDAGLLGAWPTARDGRRAFGLNNEKPRFASSRRTVFAVEDERVVRVAVVLEEPFVTLEFVMPKAHVPVSALDDAVGRWVFEGLWGEEAQSPALGVELPAFDVQTHLDAASLLRGELPEIFSRDARFGDIARGTFIDTLVQDAELHVDSTGASSLARPMREASDEPNDRALRIEPPFFFAVRRGPMPMAIGHVVR